MGERSAGFVSRAMAFVLDLLLLGLVISVAVSMLDGLDTLMGRWLTRRVRVAPLLAAVTPVVVASYFVLFWTLFGQTPGKWLLGIRVVNDDGGPVSLPRALLRFVGYMLSAAPLYAGFVWVLIDPARRAWHDRLSRTHVVYVSKERVVAVRDGQRV